MQMEATDFTIPQDLKHAERKKDSESTSVYSKRCSSMHGAHESGTMLTSADMQRQAIHQRRMRENDMQSQGQAYAVPSKEMGGPRSS